MAQRIISFHLTAVVCLFCSSYGRWSASVLSFQSMQPLVVTYTVSSMKACILRLIACCQLSYLVLITRLYTIVIIFILLGKLNVYVVDCRYKRGFATYYLSIMECRSSTHCTVISYL